MLVFEEHYYYFEVVAEAVVEAAAAAAAAEGLKSFGLVVVAVVSWPPPSLIVVALTLPSAAEGPVADYRQPFEAAVIADLAAQLLDCFFSYCLGWYHSSPRPAVLIVPAR